MCTPYYYFFFPLASWSFWQANYHFQQYPDMQIENCTQQRASFFWQGGGSWDVCVGRDFLSPSPSFPPPPLFLRTMGRHITPLVSWGEWRLERGWSEISEKYQKRCNFPCNQANNSIYINHAVYSRIWGRRRRRRLGSQQSLKGWCLFHLVGHCPLEEASRLKSKLGFFIAPQMWGQRRPIFTDKRVAIYRCVCQSAQHWRLIVLGVHLGMSKGNSVLNAQCVQIV